MHQYSVTMRQTNGYSPPLKIVEVKANSHEQAKSIAENRFRMLVLSTEIIG